MRDLHLAVLLRRDAWGNAHIRQCVAEPVGVIAPIRQQHPCARHRGKQGRRPGEVAGLPGAEIHLDGSPLAVADHVQLGVPAAFRQPDQPPPRVAAPPFFRRLEAVRCAFKYVASIMITSVSTSSFASSRRILANTPIRLQRNQRL